jgi:uncharacterized repeat protein (TIGR03847 family)
MGSFDFRDVTHFTAGALGDPGQRVFYLQVGDNDALVTVKLEKEQVQALAHFLRGALDDLPSVPDANALSLLRDPIEPVWTVGQISVGVDEADARVVLVVEELSLEDGDEGDGVLPFPGFDEGDEGNRIRARIGADQAAGFVATSDELMVQGRPPCFLCGMPVDPAGHACPRLN